MTVGLIMIFSWVLAPCKFAGRYQSFSPEVEDVFSKAFVPNFESTVSRPQVVPVGFAS